MKKKFLLGLFVCLYANLFFAQTSDYQIHLSASVVDATCQGNGQIHCSLSYPDTLALEQIRYYYIPLSGLDSIVETSMPTITHLRTGHYKIKVSALCRTGLTHENSYVILSDSIEDIYVGTSYKIPFSGMIYNIYSFAAPYGIVPSLKCEPTGKLQVKMCDGTFPYHFVITRITPTDTVFYKEITFDTNQYSGTDSLRHDYKHYYTIDSLDTGRYKILCYDGCGYYTPYLYVTIPKVRHFNSADLHLLRNSSGFPESHNIITFKELSEKQSFSGSNDDYYRNYENGHNILYYRFINPSLTIENDTTAWLPMPLFDQSAFLYDTLSRLEDYGQVWGRSIILQIQPYCGDTLFSYTFNIYSHGNNQIYMGQAIENYVEVPSAYTFCWHRDMSSEYDAINEAIASEHVRNPCYMPDTINCQNYYGYTVADLDMPYYVGITFHSYITFPLKATIINMTHDTLVFSGEVPGTDYFWSHRFLENEDFHNDSVLLIITDAYDNPLISRVMQYRKFDAHYRYGGNIHYHNWTSWDQDLDGDYFCPDQPHHLGIYQKYGLYYSTIIDGERHYLYDRDTICLVESPEDNKYNLTATAGPGGEWVVNRLRPDNHATLEKYLFRDKETNTGYPGVLFTDTNLAPGRYVWIVYKPCETNDTIIQYIDYNLPEITEQPHFRLDTTCTALNIIPVSGQYSRDGVALETFFQVYATDTLTHTASAVHKNGTLSVGLPGTYRIGMYTLPQNNGRLLALNPCFVADTVIEWRNETIELEYIYGHVCNEHDTEGFVRVKGQKGLKPYTYKLFSAPNGGGTLIATNNDGGFDQVPVRFGQTVSVELTDACNAHFITNLTISDMDKIRKCWLENGGSSMVFAEGDTCHMFGLSLGGCNYLWSGPNGFQSEETNIHVFVTGPEVAGTYCIAIEGGGCGILRDSVRLRVLEQPCPQAVDYDGNHYNAVRIDGLCWTQTNLRSTHYSDGRTVDSAYVYEHSDFTQEQMIETFGMLYRWATAADSGNIHYADAAHHVQGICPSGWYLPTRSQYERLATWGADALRVPDYWINGAGGHNETGFSALPAGFYNGLRNRFENLYGETRFWSINPDDFSENRTASTLTFFCPDLKPVESNDLDAYSVRCILAE